MKRQHVWITEDGQTFSNQEAALEHELKGIIANEFITQLRFNSATADLVARNWKDIVRIIGETKKEIKASPDKDVT